MSQAPASPERLRAWLSGGREGRRGIALAFVAGLLLPLAFAPINLFPLAIILPAIFFWLLLDVSPKRGFVLGYSLGLGYFGAGISWVVISMYRFGGMGLTLAVLTTLLFVLFLALFTALVGWLSRRYGSHLSSTLYLLLGLPALWVLLEWVRGWIFTGFPWLALGYSQTDSPLAGLAPVLGVYGVSWLTAITAGLLVLVYLSQDRKRFIVLIAAVLVWLSAGLIGQVDWSQDYGKPLTASLIQGNVPQELKWRPEQRAPTIELYTSLSRERWDRDIIIWPETALPAFYHQAASFLQGLADEAKTQGKADLLVGLPVIKDPDVGSYFNSVVKVGDDVEFYNKSHLVPFGEYIPLEAFLGRLLDILQVPMAGFSRGEPGHSLLNVAGHKAAISICYEDAFGEEVIRGLPAATLLVNVSNDAWFGDSLAPHQHLQMARMRTLETSRPMLRGTNNGVSAIIDHRGRVLATSPQFEVAVLDGMIQPRSGQTPYVVMGNWPVVSGLFLVLLITALLARKAAK